MRFEIRIYQSMVTIVVFIAILGLLIFVHELGHFLVARRNGIKTEEFGFGFPPRLFGFVKNEKSGKYKFVFGNKKVESKNTVYSINWIPLGGFVKIKGEDGKDGESSDSFAGRSAWTRIRVLVAGVIMNFILAWILISVALIIGAPEAVDDSIKDARNTKVQISQIIPGSPADEMGIKIGDEIIKATSSFIMSERSNGKQEIKINITKDLQEFTSNNKGEEITLEIKRGKEILMLNGMLRAEFPEDQGPLGASLVRTAIVSHPWYEAIWKGLTSTYELIVVIIIALFNIIKDLILGRQITVDIAGPVGIAALTHQVTTLGLVYILQFAAILSINLGIINGLPIPALDGGRILFVLIEKIKGSPISQKVEHVFHTVSFILLIALMILVTIRDFMRFDIIEGIKGLF